MLTKEFIERFRESAEKCHGVLAHMAKDLNMPKDKVRKLSLEYNVLREIIADVKHDWSLNHY